VHCVFEELVTPALPTIPHFAHAVGIYFDSERLFAIEDTTTFLANYEKALRDGTLTAVVKAYEHALLARHPRARYLVGQDAVYKARLAAMPEWYSDWKIDSKSEPLPAACR